MNGVASDYPMASATATSDSASADLGQKFILVADIGTTNIRCHIYNKAAQIVAQAEQEVNYECGRA